MFRKLAGVAVLGLLFCATAVLADEVKGKLTKVDDANNKITVSVDGKDTEYTVAKDCKMPKNRKDSSDMTLKDLGKLVERAKDKGNDVKVVATTKKDGGKEVVSEIKMDRPGKKDKTN